MNGSVRVLKAKDGDPGIMGEESRRGIHGHDDVLFIGTDEEECEAIERPGPVGGPTAARFAFAGGIIVRVNDLSTLQEGIRFVRQLVDLFRVNARFQQGF